MAISSRKNSVVQKSSVTQTKHKRRRYDSMAIPPPAWAGGFKFKPAARYLSISEPSLHRLIARGLIKPSRALRQ